MPEMALAFASAGEAARPASGRQADFLAGRLAAVRAVHALTGAQQAVIARAADGKPVARTPDRWIELNISHLDGRAAAVATAAGCRVGIDLVRVLSVQRSELRFFLSAREQRHARASDASVFWALKEAAWKALGGTPLLPFKNVELELQDGVEVNAVCLQGRSQRAGSLILPPWPGFTVALVWLEPA